MQENPESQEKKETKGNFFEAPGVPKAESKEEPGARFEGKTKETSESTASLEREEPKKSDFKLQGELETGYTEESWAKPESNMEEKTTLEPGEKREEKAAEEIREKVRVEAEEAREEVKGEAKEEVKGEAKEEVKGEAKEEVKGEAKEEKRTTYTMKKRLTKSKKERMLFGVCGGLGEYFGIDPTFIRLAFAALALHGGIGIVLYIILAIIMPSGENFEMVPSTQGSEFQR